MNCLLYVGEEEVVRSHKEYNEVEALLENNGSPKPEEGDVGKRAKMEREKIDNLLKERKRNKSIAKFFQSGPSAFTKDQTHQVKAMAAKAGEIGKFWKGIWKTEGTYKPPHPAIVKWVRSAKMTVADKDVSENMDRDKAWKVAVKKQPG